MNIDKQIDIVFKEANEMFWADKFEEYQDILDNLDLSSMSTQMIICYLVTSHWARPKLPNRFKFVNRAVEILKEKEPERWERLIYGLK